MHRTYNNRNLRRDTILSQVLILQSPSGAAPNASYRGALTETKHMTADELLNVRPN